MLSEATSGSATTMLLCGVDISPKPVKIRPPKNTIPALKETKIQEAGPVALPEYKDCHTDAQSKTSLTINTKKHHCKANKLHL